MGNIKETPQGTFTVKDDQGYTCPVEFPKREQAQEWLEMRDRKRTAELRRVYRREAKR